MYVHLGSPNDLLASVLHIKNLHQFFVSAIVTTCLVQLNITACTSVMCIIYKATDYLHYDIRSTTFYFMSIFRIPTKCIITSYFFSLYLNRTMPLNVEDYHIRDFVLFGFSCNLTVMNILL